MCPSLEVKEETFFVKVNNWMLNPPSRYLDDHAATLGQWSPFYRWKVEAQRAAAGGCLGKRGSNGSPSVLGATLETVWGGEIAHTVLMVKGL